LGCWASNIDLSKNKNMPHIAQVLETPIGQEFSIEFTTSKGERIKCKRACFTSIHSSGTTVNIRLIESQQIRSIQKYSIIKFNKQNVWI